MKLRILTVSTKPPGWVSEGVSEYVKRMPANLPIDIVEIAPEKRRKGDSAANVLKYTAAEGVKLQTALNSGDWVVALDERGSSVTSVKLADKLSQWQERGQDVAFLIGGADGLDTDLRQRADETLCLSSMTLPHHLVRIVLVEALYRAWSILSGHPYHRA